MKRITVFLLLLLLAVIQLAAASYDVFRYIDILHTDLHINVSSHTSALDGEVHFSAVAVQDLNEETSIGMHAYRLHIDSAAVNGERAEVYYHLPIPPPEFFVIVLPETMSIPEGDTITVSIWYTRIDYPDMEEDRDGYYFFKKDESRWGQTALETIGYTMSQPRDARAWFPTVDKPWNKSTLSMHITIDPPVNVIANGELLDTVDNPVGSVTYIYDHQYPIAPYLFAFNFGPFEEYGDVYNSIDGRDIPIASYLIDDDATWAEQANAMMKDMLGVFEEMFGPYPFERYGMIAIQPFKFAGMEHQTISTMNRTHFLNERVVAHELAHHWWGNLVTCEDWKNIWLNEGFASYAEALYTEVKYGIPQRDIVMKRFADRYFTEDSQTRYPIYDPPDEYLFGIAIYLKGAWVLHMLRNIVGDDSFFAALRGYADQHVYSTAVTDDLQHVFEQETGMDNLDWFFSQWVYQAGYPVYQIDSEVTEAENQGMYDISLALRQIQTNAPEVFQAPVEFLLRHEQGDTVFTFWNDQREQNYLFSFESKPDTIIFDPDNKILKKFDDASSVEKMAGLPDRITLYQNYPNPFNATTVIEYAVPEAMSIRLRVIDALGREVKILVDGLQQAGVHTANFDASGYASGIYFIVMEAGGFSKVRKMTYIR